MPDFTLGPAARKLLRLLAEYDAGAGVVFEHLPFNRWRLPMTGDIFRGQTFHPLERHGLADVGGSNSDPVRITAAGREATNA